MVKNRNRDILPTLGGIFALFVVFNQCISMVMSLSIRLQALLLPSLWLVLGACLLTSRQSWVTVLGLLPLSILMVSQSISPLPMTDAQAFVNAILSRTLPGIAFGLLLVLALLAAACIAVGIRRKMWIVPVLLFLPACILQNNSALLWAQFGTILSVSLWLKPAGR